MPKKEPVTVTSAKITATGPIIVAIIGLIGTLILGYWQFVLKPNQADQAIEAEYVGRVIDINNKQAIAGAKITLDLEGVPPIVFSDSEGVYRFKVVIESNISGQIRVDAQGYQVYTRNITISPDIKIIEDIRLTPQNATVSPTQTLIFTPTPNSTLTAMLAQVSTPNPIFTPQLRTVDGTEQVWVPEGSFVAGDINGIGYDDEKPFHKVYTDGFWIDRNLITNSEYASCPEAICSAPHKLNSHARPNGYYNVPAYGNYPVMNVTWQQANDYCEWRNGRLPREAEFEKAAGWNPKTGVTLLYPWGDLPPTDELANYDGIDRDTRPVGSYPKGMSPIGAYDMAGNIWEWIFDWYSETYYADNIEWSNPAGPADGIYKVIRGGSWFSDDIRWLRVSNRGKSVPGEDANEIGFRCVNDN
ncbi:MAG: SUMF1/EgtB/PvdO family nonheme iron enzyme [Anaerolineales bacterium]|nr:SUMF1/EgtB/PvdO family nonheme iron enzyme [Anaerolineales bacterium]